MRRGICWPFRWELISHQKARQDTKRNPRRRSASFSRSAPVLGRSNTLKPESSRIDESRRSFECCCARGRAHSDQASARACLFVAILENLAAFPVYDYKTCVRRLADPTVLKSAALAALGSAVLCYPRFALWPARRAPIWYLEAVMFFGGIVLWAFVFAWHTRYTERPVFTMRWSPTLFGAATLAGVLAAIGMHEFIDASLRAQTPEDYPASFTQWLAMTLFSLSFAQLFLVFAPVAWLMRLCRNRTAAMALTM